MNNALRMSFAEWLFRMSDDRVPYQARALAVYAVAFKVIGNDDLARLSGMDSQGKADQTFNRWKRLLRDDGWVLIENEKGGRGRGITLTPAYRKTPVEFTDLSQRDPRKFIPSLHAESTVEKTPVIAPDRGVEKTPVTSSERGVEVTETPVILTPVVPSRALAPAHFELPSEVHDLKEVNPPLSPMPVFGHASAVTIEHGQIVLKNGLRQFWLDRFEGDAGRLDLALMQARPYVQENSRRPLEAQVSAQLARAVADKIDRDRRYAAAAQANGKGPKEGSTNRTMRIGQMLDEQNGGRS